MWIATQAAVQDTLEYSFGRKRKQEKFESLGVWVPAGTARFGAKVRMPRRLKLLEHTRNDTRCGTLGCFGANECCG